MKNAHNVVQVLDIPMSKILQVPSSELSSKVGGGRLNADGAGVGFGQWRG